MRDLLIINHEPFEQAGFWVSIWFSPFGLKGEGGA